MTVIGRVVGMRVAGMPWPGAGVIMAVTMIVIFDRHRRVALDFGNREAGRVTRCEMSNRRQ